MNKVDPDGRDVYDIGYKTGVSVVGAMIWPDLFLRYLMYAAPSIEYVMGTGTLPSSGGGGGSWDWYNKVFNGVNTNISLAERNNILADAKEEIDGRVSGQCETFINSVIAGLKGKINSAITSASDLLSIANKSASYDAYAAINLTDAQGRTTLTTSGFAFAKTLGNTIYLGENIFDPTLKNSYDNWGGDATATVIHEFCHLGAVSANGKNLEESDLNDAVGGNFSAIMKTKCGPN